MAATAVVKHGPYKKNIPTARTRRQAEEAERQAIQDIHEGRYESRQSAMLFYEFVKQVYEPWTKEHHKQFENELYYPKLFSEYFKGKQLRQISEITIEGYKHHRLKTPSRRKETRKNSSVNCELLLLSGIFSKAVEFGFLRRNPCRRVELLPVEKSKKRRLTVEEEETLMSELEAGPAYLKPLVTVGINTGFRQRDLLTLRKVDVDFRSDLIFVSEPKWKNDPRKTEGFPIPHAIRELLQTLCRETPGEYVFANERGEPLTKSEVTYQFHKARLRAGLDWFNFHRLRHEFGSRLGDRDVNQKKIARLMGHASTQQTDGYVHPVEQGLREAVEMATAPKSARESTRIVPGEGRKTA